MIYQNVWASLFVFTMNVFYQVQFIICGPVRIELDILGFHLDQLAISCWTTLNFYEFPTLIQRQTNWKLCLLQLRYWVVHPEDD